MLWFPQYSDIWVMRDRIAKHKLTNAVSPSIVSNDCDIFRQACVRSILYLYTRWSRDTILKGIRMHLCPKDYYSVLKLYALCAPIRFEMLLNCI